MDSRSCLAELEHLIEARHKEFAQQGLRAAGAMKAID
jgi:hypothetical protein